MNLKPRDVVSASEIASWEWCPESWRLDALGKGRSNKEELFRGETFHARTAAIEVWSRRAVTTAVAVLILALAVGVLYFLLLRFGER